MRKKLLLATGVMSSILWGDFRLEYQMEGDMKQIVQYRDAQHVLITMKGNHKGESSEQLILGDKKFMIIEENGKKRYMDMDAMMQQMKQLSGMMGSENREADSSFKFKVIHKGDKKKVAGVDAQVWRLEINENGKKENMDVVVTNNKRVVDAIKKYSQVMKQLTNMGDDALISLMNIKDGYAVIEFEGMHLLNYSNADIPDSLFALPTGMKVENSQKGGLPTKTQKPPLCPVVGTHGVAKQLSKILKPKANGWKLIESANCMNMMGMQVENAIYQKENSYIHIGLSINVDGENGMIAKYRKNNMKVDHLKRGKIEGMEYQTGLLELIGQNVMDIKLPNAMLTLTATRNCKDDLSDFAKEALDLSKFVPVKKTKPSADDALKALGAIFGGDGASNNKASDSADMQKAGELLKGLFGK
jgi:hypothetical protein